MEFLTYKKFYERERAEHLIQILQDNGIEFQLTEDRDSLDSLYGHKQFNSQFFIKIKEADFGKADSIILSMAETEMETVDKDHYLFEFSDDELFDILTKPDEWSVFDYQLAGRILKQRGKEVNAATIDLLKKQRIRELTKPEESQKAWIYTGYICALLGGFLGVAIGYHLMTFKKTLPNGQRLRA